MVGDSFSVVIPTQDRRDQVRAQLDLLRSLEGAPDQVVIVDDGSSDGTSDHLCALVDPPVVVRTERVGPASARNRGADEAVGDWLVFLDDDDQPDADWMVALRDLAAAHPRATHLSLGTRDRSGDQVTSAPIADLGPAFSDAHASFLAGTFAVRRDVFETLGGFRAGLRCMEFTELAMRLFEVVPAERRAADEAPRITILRRTPEDRVSQRPDTYVACVRTVLAEAGHRLARDPSYLADTLASLGVAEVRLGEVRAGRRHLWQAARLRPWPPTHAARLLVSASPALRRRVWSRTS